MSFCCFNSYLVIRCIWTRVLGSGLVLVAHMNWLFSRVNRNWSLSSDPVLLLFRWFSRPDSGWDWIRPESEPSYLLLTPTALRTGLPTSVAVTVLGSSSVTVSAEIYQERGGVLSKNSTVVKGGGSGVR